MNLQDALADGIRPSASTLPAGTPEKAPRLRPAADQMEQGL